MTLDPSTTRDRAARCAAPWVLILAAILALALMGGALVIGARLALDRPARQRITRGRDAADRLPSRDHPQERRHRDHRGYRGTRRHR